MASSFASASPRSSRRAAALGVLGVFATALFYSSLSTLVSCGSDNSTSFGGPSGGDGSSGSTDGAGGGGGPDAGLGGDGASTPSLTLLVHASADADDFRLCFGTTDDPDGGGANVSLLTMAPLPDDPAHPMPRTNYPGVPAGGGVVLSASLAGAKTYLVPYLVNAETLATKSTLAGKTCDQIFCGSGASCLKATDYDTLPAIPTAGVNGPGTRMFVVTGCRAGTAVPSRCGADYNASTGNLALKRLTLDPVSISTPAQIGVQIAELSPVLGKVQASYGALDGGTSLGVVAYGTVGPTAAAPSPRPTTDPAFETMGIRVTTVDDAGATGASYAMSLAAVATASDPTQVPETYLAGGHNFVFVVMGDPAYPADDAGTQLVRGLHAVALPTTVDRDGAAF